MASNSEKFRYNSAFCAEASISSIRYGHDMPLLEVELNEMQEIQNAQRQSLARALTPSGFIEIVSNDFAAEPIIYQPVDINNNVLNSIAIAPCKAIVNGLSINLTGNFAVNDANNYIFLNLGEAPDTGTREDLVYLEVWLQKVSFNEPFYNEGYLHGNKISYNIFDSRINAETSRRVVLRYDIKVVKDIDFNTFPDGLGFIDSNMFSNVQATVDGSLGYGENINLVFRPASDNIFLNQPFFNDRNLFVAGRPDYTFINENIIGNYIFALPMLRVKRHNKQPYSLQNYNGSRTTIHKYLDSSSAEHGDLLNNIRPDKACYDVLTEEDILDIRRSISTDILNDYYLNRSLYNLFTGKLQTKEKQTTRRVQFGRRTVDYSDNNYVILHSRFDDNSIEPDVIENFPSVVSFDSNERTYIPIFKKAIIGTGLYIDGRAEYKYTLTDFSADRGTMDFYIQPYWDGHSDTIQTLFRLFDANGNAAIICKKQKSELIIQVVVTQASATASEIVQQLIVDLTEHLILAKRTYIIRFSWSKEPTISKAIVYLNGSVVGKMDYIGTTIVPTYIILGNKTDAVTYAGADITEEDEVILENIYTDQEEQTVLKERWLQYTEVELALGMYGRDIYNKLLYNIHALNVALPISDFNDLENVDDANISAQNITDEFNESVNLLTLENMILTDITAETEDGMPLTEDLLETEALTEEEYEVIKLITKMNQINNSLINNLSNIDTDAIIDEELYHGKLRILRDDISEESEIISILAEEDIRVKKLEEDLYIQEQKKYAYQQTEMERICKKRENLNYGFVIEELTVFAYNYEERVNDGITEYTTNSYWPGIPNDFIANQALLLPSFNSLNRGFSDNVLYQDYIVRVISGKNGVFSINIKVDDSEIKEEPKIYKINGEVDEQGHILTIPGTWKQSKGKWTFIAVDVTLMEAVVIYSLTTKNGNGFEDLPVEMLSAGYVTSTDIVEECSFARKNTTNYRPVSYLNPDRVSADVDRAFDHSTTRNQYGCYARILYYHVSGNLTNNYKIPTTLYGYPVINIISVTNRSILHIMKIDDTDDQKGQFEIWLTETVSYGEVIEFVIALGGLTFDYETQTKTLVSNIERTQTVSFYADGLHRQFLIPVYIENGGILKAVCSVVSLADDGSEVYKHACYINGEMYPNRPERDESGMITSTYSYQLAELTVDETSWNTPFLKVALDFTPEENSLISIPMLVTYQPAKTEVLSLWYKYVPYQGILNKTHKKLKRLTNWKYFITTLSSGNKVLNPEMDNVNSLNNIVNRLPGGNAFAAYLTGEKIILKEDISAGRMQNLYNAYIVTDKEINSSINSIDELYNQATFASTDNTDSIALIQNRINNAIKKDANYELRFLDQALFTSTDNKLDNSFFELDTDMEIYRYTKGFQDEKLNYTFNKFKAYLPDCLLNISKYTGMACLVVDELGQILLFIIGSLNNNKLNQNVKSKENIIEPIYGDLFKLNHLPTTLQRF